MALAESVTEKIDKGLREYYARQGRDDYGAEGEGKFQSFVEVCFVATIHITNCDCLVSIGERL